MADKVYERFAEADAVVMAAAVADYRPKRVSEEKLKKGEGPLSLELERTADILAELGHRKASQVLIGFALETGDGRLSAERKLGEKSLDAIVLNGPSTFGSERIRAEFLEADGGWFDPVEETKGELADRVMGLAEELVRRKGTEDSGKGRTPDPS